MRLALLSFGCSLVVGCSSVAPDATQSAGTALPATATAGTVQTSSDHSSVPDPMVDTGQLIGRDWGLVGPLDTGVTPETEEGIIGHLHIERNGADRFVATLEGCFAGTFPVTFDGVHELRIEAIKEVSVCANPFDESSHLDELVSHSVSWQVSGSTLTLADGDIVEFTLVDQTPTG